MADKTIFLPSDYGYWTEETISYKHYGMDATNKNFVSFHAALKDKFPSKRILEISTLSDDYAGTQLSAFNLKYDYNGKLIPLESLYQGSKVYEDGGPYTDMYDYAPIDAKQSWRHTSSGKLVGYQLDGEDFKLDPPTLFYDWIYLNALVNSEYAKDLLEYDIFTDFYYQKTGTNCQARAAAIYVSLVRKGELMEKLSSRDAFRSIYPAEQLTIEDLLCSLN